MCYTDVVEIRKIVAKYLLENVQVATTHGDMCEITVFLEGDIVENPREINLECEDDIIT